MRTALVLVAWLLTPALMLHAAERGTKAPQPNFVVISIDDLGYADIGPFGGQAATPHLDRMAKEGRRFTSFYAAASVCTPSRAGLLTGCYPARVDMLTNDLAMDVPNHVVLWPGDRKGLNPAEQTIAEALRDRGYATACIGKWHLVDQPAFLPTRQGFDEYLGIPFSNDMGNVRPFFAPLPLVRGEKVLEEVDAAGQNQLTKRFTDEAVKFIREHQTKPFFLYLPHAMVHDPLSASTAFKGKSALGALGDSIAEVDWSVGQILGMLRELKLDEKTLVIFTSDNGPSNRPAPPYSGWKGTMAEGGFRAPTIAWRPKTIPAGERCDLLASLLDLPPTFAALSGEPLRAVAERPIDGVDASSLFRGELPKRSPRSTFAYYRANVDPQSSSRASLQAVREQQWKLYLKPQRFRLVTQAAMAEPAEIAAGSLFDLSADPGEINDVATAHPEVIARLRILAERLAAELGDDGRVGSGVRTAGMVEVGRPLNANR